MNLEKKLTYLRVVLVFTGIVALSLYPLMHLWPSGWRWNPNQYQYEQMMVGIYATLGIFLIIAAKNPLANISLIKFTIWSSLVHATIMLFQVIYAPNEYPHLYGDIPALYIAAILLAIFLPTARERGRSDTSSL